MGRAPCCDKSKVKKGPWSPEEDATLKNYIEKHGTGGNWIALPHKIGLKRCGKSCRLRWLNYLRPNIKHGEFSEDEDTIICTLFATIGSRWSIIAGQLPGRTDNDIKNYWNTKLKKKLMIASVAPPPPNNYHQKKHHNQIITNFSSQPSNNSSLFIGSSYSSPSLFNCTQLPVYNKNDAVFASNADGLVGHVQGNYYLNYNQISGGPSCSSSDGSCITNNQISCRNIGKELVEPDYNRFLQSLLLSNNGVLSDDTKFMISGSSNYISDGCFVGDQNPVDHSIEEIKQLISSTNTNINSSNSLNFFVDEIKTEDKLLFDY